MVFEDGKLIASSRVEWISKVKEQFAGPLKVGRNLSAVSSSSNLVSETLSNFGDPADRQVHDCCIWARIGRYTLDGSGLIVDVRFFSNTMALWADGKSIESR